MSETEKRPVEGLVELPEIPADESQRLTDEVVGLAASARLFGEKAPMMWLHGYKGKKGSEELTFACLEKKVAPENRFFAIAKGEAGVTVTRMSFWLTEDIMDFIQIPNLKLTEKDHQVFASFEMKAYGPMKQVRHIVHGSGRLFYNVCLKEQVEKRRAEAKSKKKA